MKKQTKEKMSPAEARIRRSSVVTVLCDVVLIVAMVICLFAFIAANNAKTYEQNVESISNIAKANSRLMEVAIDNAGYEVKSARNYCEGKSVTEIMDYLALIMGEGEEYQLIKKDEAVSTDTYKRYVGYSTKRDGEGYISVMYEDTSLVASLEAAQTEGGQIYYSQSFTNVTDALRYFAVFCGVGAVEADGTSTRYMLVKPQRESKVLIQAQARSQYTDLALAICYTDGKYLACDNNFRANNFYDYLYNYNGLSLDEKNAIRASVQSDADGEGVLTYLDYQRRECVFAYAACGESDNWLVIVSVPVSEFVSEKLVSFFPLIIIIFLAVMLIFNVVRLLSMVKQLRVSMVRERIANTAKSSFLSRMSHEIRTPLNAIIGYNTIARGEMTDAKTDEQRRQAEMKTMDCLEKSGIASKHLLTIINDVLDMSAIESGKIKIAHDRFDFKGLITSLTTVFYSQASTKGIDFEVVFGTLTEEWFLGDQMRVNQVLTNLLSNAIKFTPEGGTVVLHITQPEAATNASHIHFEVSDTGIGMAPSYMEHIFTPFEQADASITRRFGGTGLGLSITKSLIDLMGGKITVESAPGVGTTFRVDLTFERTEQPLANDSYDFTSVNALVVDDDQSTCDYIRLLFNRCGARCAAVLSGADAVKAVSVAMEQSDRYSVCLVDWRMPKMDGIETIRKIREIAGEDMPIIVLTAYDYTEIADKAMEVGVSRFISKPLFQSSLFDLLANICGAQSKKEVERNEKVDFKGARILLAEDNAMNMEIARTIMESVGLVIDSAWNGKEAVEMFEKSAPGTYMAILMDVHMPVMNGHDATRAIRLLAHPEAKTIPIIAMTADAFAENVAEARAAGMNGHIAKPIDIPTLFETLRRYHK